ncbi:phosphate/phosphite/phosphonate ABC transporter substrate-binding protein [Streptacidiphilus carbonis]|uniref:phosphate/phosphite/phosphonate ABC transporter substrate-binding protein n=1 Tax=Streptacidiphilus carbonis TaxID=105422 RepID=UPI000694ABFB|nr:PhnD/SsuA/transferrin family substrate-binding protein [Streptacidiphilus carbonis]
MTLLMGAVAYDPKVVTIWEGFRRFLVDHGLPFDFILYSHYERQAEDLVAGRIDAAWNSPLAWVRARRLAGAAGARLEALVMRDTDRDLRSVIVVRGGSGVESLSGLDGATVGVGAVDSPQATLLPLSLLRNHGLAAGTNLTIRRFDVGVGLHGDHVGGERDAARALIAGEVDAACMIDASHLLFAREGLFTASSTRIIAETEPYDHCNMTTGPSADPVLAARFRELLLGMSYEDAELRSLLDLEGLKTWRPGRTSGYQALESAVDEARFYGEDGALLADDYRP